MSEEIHLQPEKRKWTVLRTIAINLLGLAGIVLICYSGFIGVIVVAMARVRGSDTGDLIMSSLVSAAIGVALLISAVKMARRQAFADRYGE